MEQHNIWVAYNDFTGRIKTEGDLAGDSEENKLKVLSKKMYDKLKRNSNITVSRADINDAIFCIAVENHYNPVKEMLENTTWDRTPRVLELVSILGIADDDYLSKKLLWKWLAQTVAMAYNDNYDKPYGAEGVLTLQGPQGLAKTQFFRKLAVYDEWFHEGLSFDLNNKDKVIAATRVWITELGELDSTLNRKQAQLKSFLTNSSDEIRNPYAIDSVRKPRKTSFCATVNPERFLKDETGNRRFWVIPVKCIDTNKLFQCTQGYFVQLWREVYERWYLKDPQFFRLTPEEQEEVEKRNAGYCMYLPAELDLIENLDWESTYRKQYTCTELKELMNCLKKYDVSQIGKALTKLSKNPDYGITITNGGNYTRYNLPRID